MGKLTILSALASPVVDYFDRRRDRKHQEFRLEMELKTAKAHATAQHIATGQKADIDWEIESIRNSGWKDEYLTVLTSIVLVLVFIPPTQPYVMDGLAALNDTPIWFQLIILMVYGSAFGIRVFDNFKKVFSHGK